MKKTLLICAGMILGSSVFAQLSGTYTVYGTTPDYATIQDACSDLETNGQTGPVVFSIRDGVHAESITLNAVTGNDATNTITFESESMDSTAVIVTSTTATTFEFTDVNYVNFSFIGIGFTGATGEAVSFTNGGDGVTFDNTAVYYSSLSASPFAIAADKDSGINGFTFSNSSLVSDSSGIDLNSSIGDINNLTIENTSISADGYGFRAYAEKFMENMTVDGSTISSTFGGIEVQGYYGGMTNFNITNSILSSTDNDAFYGYTDFAFNNLSIDNSEFYSTNSRAFYGEGYYSGIQNWDVTNSKFEGSTNGFTGDTDNSIRDITFINDSIITFQSGGGNAEALRLNGNGLIENVNITESYFKTDSLTFGGGPAVAIDADGVVTDINFSNNEVRSEQGFEIDNYGKVDRVIVSENEMHVDDDAVYIISDYGTMSNVTVDMNVLNSADDAIYLYSDATAKNSMITNNTIICSGYGIDLEGYYGGIDNINVSDNNITSDGNIGVYLYTDAILENCVIQNNFVDADSEGAYLEGYYGGIRNLSLSENTWISAQDYGIYIYTDGKISDIQITNDSIRSSDQGIYAEAGYAEIEKLSITDNYSFSENDEAIYILSYGEITNTEVMRNIAVGDTTVFNSDQGIYIESDDSGIDSLILTDNIVYSNDIGIEIEADYGNMINSVIAHNNIYASEYGVYVDGAGDNSEISYNNIYPLLSNDPLTNYGIYAYGYDGPNTGITITENFMENINEIGIEASYLNNLIVDNNEVGSAGITSAYGVYAEYIGGESRINANHFLFENGSYGVYVEYSNFSATNPLVISNNFITGADRAFYFEYTSFIDVLHNSTSSAIASNIFDLFSASDLTIKNNILKSYNTFGEIYSSDNNSSNIDIDFNVYHYDTNTVNMVNDGFFGTYASPFDFQTGTSYDGNSIYEDPQFVNDTTDLHVPCSLSALTFGMPTSVTTDIDGAGRNGSNPTVGAHEIDPIIANLLEDSVLLCNTVDLMTSADGAYLWSTGESTQSITVSTPDTYYLTVTGYCGNTMEDSTVVYHNNPIADFAWGLNGFEAVFNNLSSGGDSYSWDFGDGNTSTDENPIHNYTSGGTYTVTLTVMDECGGMDTSSVEFLVSLASVENESLSSRGVNVYPNPTRGNVTIDFSMLLGEDITLYLINTDGRIVQQDVISNQNGAFEKQMDLSTLSKGMYFLRIDAGTETITKRIVKQ